MSSAHFYPYSFALYPEEPYPSVCNCVRCCGQLCLRDTANTYCTRALRIARINYMREHNNRCPECGAALHHYNIKVSGISVPGQPVVAYHCPDVQPPKYTTEDSLKSLMALCCAKIDVSADINGNGNDALD